MFRKWGKGLLVLLLGAAFMSCPNVGDAEFEVVQWSASETVAFQGGEITFKGEILAKNPQALTATITIEKGDRVVTKLAEEKFAIKSKVAETKSIEATWKPSEEQDAGAYVARLTLSVKGIEETKTKEIPFTLNEFGAPLVVVKVNNNNPEENETVTVDTTESKAAVGREDTVKKITYSFLKIVDGGEMPVPDFKFTGASETEFGEFTFRAPSDKGTYKLRVAVVNNSDKLSFADVTILIGEDEVDPDSVEFGAAFGPKNYRFYHTRYDQMEAAETTDDNKHEVALKTQAARTLKVHGWKNDVVNAQLVTWTAPTEAADITVEKSDLTIDGSSSIIPSSSIVISRMKYIFTNNTVAHYKNGAVGDYTETNVNYDAGANGLNYYADCLYATTDKETSYKVEKKKFQPYWIQINIPKTAEAGTYSGTITVGFNGLKIKLNVELEVLNITVPDYKDREFVLHTWMHPQAMVHSYCGCFPDDKYDIALSGDYVGEHKCGVTENGIMTVENGKLVNKTKLWTDEHFKWYLPVLQELYKAGQRNLFINLVKDPWPNNWGGHGRGHIQQTYYSYDDLVIWKCKGDTSKKENWSVDLTYLKEYLEWAMDTKLENGEKMEWKWIDCTGPLVWGTGGGMRIFYYDTADENKYKIFTGNANSNMWWEVWKVFFTDFKEYLVEKGWFEKVRISVDERGIDNIAKLNNQILSQEAFKYSGKMIKTSAAGNNNHNIHDVNNSNRIQFFSFDGGVTGPNLRAGDDSTMKGIAQNRRTYTGEYSGGNDTTFSTTVSTYPSHANNGLPAESQFFGWYAARLDFSGHLKWAFDSWSGPMVNPKDPEEIRTFPLLSADNKIFPAGDASHIYPGDHDADVPFIRSSVRQELAKEGYLYYDKIKYMKKTYSSSASEIDELLNSETAKRPQGGRGCPGTDSTDYRGRKYLYHFSDKVDQLEKEFYEIVKKYTTPN